MKKVTVIIIGDPKDEHFTYIQYKDEYYQFYTDGYDGTKCKEVINILKFLGFEVFEVYKSRGNKLVTPVNKSYQSFV